MTHTSLPGGPVQQISDDAITLPYFFVSAGLETLFLNEFLLGKNRRPLCFLSAAAAAPPLNMGAPGQQRGWSSNVAGAASHGRRFP
jgi:hypothetical protein